MRVGLDYRSAIRPHPTGVGRYTRDLAAGLAQSGHGDALVLLHDERGRPAAETPRQMASSRLFQRNGMRQLWEETWAPLAVARLGVEVYHSPNGLLPYALPRSAATVVTVHDVFHRRVPEAIGAMFRRRLDLGYRHALRRADWVIADSASTARDLCRCYDCPTDRLVVIHLGVDAAFRPVDDLRVQQEALDRYGLRLPYLLYVGSFEPRKNAPTLLAAFARLRARLPAPVQLVLGGSPRQAGPLRAQAERLGIAADVRFPGYVADADLPALYSAAAVFAFPSLYEGFGYPIVEAMACGAPVVCSDTSSLPEVAGDAALLIPPDDVDAWVAALHTILTDPDAAARRRAAGLRQAARFTLRAEAEQTWAVYEAALARRARRAARG